MAELFNTKCAQGRLIITDQFIQIQRPMNMGQQTMLRTSFVGVDSRVTVFPFFKLTKGASTLIFKGQGLEVLQADVVETPTAREIVAMLQQGR